MIFHDTDWSSLQERSLLSFMTCDIGNLQTFKGHCLQRRIAVSKWIEKSFERLRSEEYSCRILRIMSLSVRQLDNVSILERVSFFYRFLGFIDFLTWILCRTSRHESWIAHFSDGREDSNNMWENVSISIPFAQVLVLWSVCVELWKMPEVTLDFSCRLFFVKMLEVDFFPFRCYWYFCWRYICRLRSLMDCSHGKVMISERCGKSLMWDPYHRVSIQCD